MPEYEVGSLYALIGVDNKPFMAGMAQTQAAMKETAAKLDAVNAKSGASMAKLGSRMQSVGKTMSKWVTLPIVGAGVVSAKFAIDFQSQMEMVQTQAGASQQEVTKMSKAVLALAASGKVNQGPQELAKGLFHLESVGLRGAKALDALKVAAEGAAVGGSNLEDTASALAGVVITGIKGTENYSHAMGILNATVGAGNMKMQDLVEALKSGIAPVAKTAGLSLQSLAAGLAMMTDEGVPAGTAANRLRTAIFMMTNPTQKASGVLKDLGLKTTTLGDDLRKPDGLMVAMQDLQRHMEGIKNPTERLADLGKLFGGSRSAGTIAMLLNNLDRLGLKYDQIGKTSDRFNHDVAKTQQTTAFKLKASWAQIQASMVKVGNAIGPTMASIAAAVARAATAFSKLSPHVKNVVLAIAGIAAAAGPVVYVGGAFVKLASAVKALNAMLTITTARAGAAAPALAADGVAADGAAASFGLLGPVAIAAGVGLAAYYHSTKPNVQMSAQLTANLAALQAKIDAGGQSAKGYTNTITETTKKLGDLQAGFLKVAKSGVDQAEMIAKAKGNVETYASDMGRLANQADAAAAANARLNPGLSAGDRAAAAYARAAQELAIAIGHIPSHKQVMIQVTTDYLNRYSGGGGGAASGANPTGHPHLPPVVKKPPGSSIMAGSGMLGASMVMQMAHSAQAAAPAGQAAFARIIQQIMARMHAAIGSYGPRIVQEFKNLATQITDAFDAQTQKMQNALDKQLNAQTQAGKELQALESAHDEAARQQAITDARAALATATAQGNPAAILAAQQALDDALYQERVAQLEKLDAAEQAARAKKVKAEKAALAQQRAEQKRHIAKVLAELKAAEARAAAIKKAKADHSAKELAAALKLDKGGPHNVKALLKLLELLLGGGTTGGASGGGGGIAKPKPPRRGGGHPVALTFERGAFQIHSKVIKHDREFQDLVTSALIDASRKSGQILAGIVS